MVAIAPAEQAVREGVNILILSDRGVSPDLAPIPMLLATGAVHHHLIRETLRTRCGLICETGEAREVAHMALLIGYGAAGINPYLAFQTLEELVDEGTYTPEELDVETAKKNFIKANDKGLLKTFAKMGISTLASYRGAQIFEAIGLDRDLVDSCFTGTASRVSGVGYDVLARETAMRHARAFPGEEFAYIVDGEVFLWEEGVGETRCVAGESAKVPMGAVHTIRTGDQGVKLVVFRVHTQGEPERILAED